MTTMLAPPFHEELSLTAPSKRGANDQGERQTRDAMGSAVSNVFMVTVWFAVFTGGVEGVYWLLWQQLADGLTFIHPGFLWICPTTWLVLFAIPGGVAGVFAYFKKSASVVSFTVTLLSIVAWLNLCELVFPHFYLGASIILACGLAAVTGQLFDRYVDRCITFMRRTTVWLVLGVVLIGAGQSLQAWYRERTAVASTPVITTEVPNVLLVVLDTVRADVLDEEDADGEIAPNLRRFAERGVTFCHATATAPWTLPSQAGMFTGRLPHEISADWTTKLDSGTPTLAEELAARGWLTAGFVGNTRYCSKETGIARGFSHYDDYQLSWMDGLMCTALGRKVLLSPVPVQLGMYGWPARKRARAVSSAFLNWLDRNPGKPFFAFVNYFDAHDPYVPANQARDEAPISPADQLIRRNFWHFPKERISETKLTTIRGEYGKCVRGLDHEIGQLLEQLEERRVLENTLVIITADHGEHFGEHGLYLHGNSLYEPLINVPLICIWKNRIPEGISLDTPVSLRDLPATIMDLLGAESDLPGVSLQDFWTVEPASQVADRAVFAELASQATCPPCHGRSPVASGPMRCVRLGKFKYIRNGDGSEELYDLANDQGEEHNQVTQPGYTQHLQRLRDVLGATPSADR